MRTFFVMCLYFSILFVSAVDAQDTTPYLYYYSTSEDAFMIERADGTDRHILGADLDLNAGQIEGLGWSPNGQWFAFQAYGEQGLAAQVVRLNDDNQPDSIEAFVQLGMTADIISWSPDGRYLLSRGQQSLCDMNECTRLMYWLIDVENDSVAAWLDFRLGERGPGHTPIEWSVEEGWVRFFEKEAYVPTETTLSSIYRITMYTDGRVTKEPITREEWQILFQEELPLTNTDDIQLLSPSGRYVITNQPDELLDTVSGMVVTLPVPEFFTQIPFQLINAEWSTNEEWVLLRYNVYGTGLDGTSVIRTDGTSYRELSTCGFAPACVGWLPANVDVSQIPLAG